MKIKSALPLCRSFCPYCSSVFHHELRYIPIMVGHLEDSSCEFYIKYQPKISKRKRKHNNKHRSTYDKSMKSVKIIVGKKHDDGDQDGGDHDFDFDQSFWRESSTQPLSHPLNHAEKWNEVEKALEERCGKKSSRNPGACKRNYTLPVFGYISVRGHHLPKNHLPKKVPKVEDGLEGETVEYVLFYPANNKMSDGNECSCRMCRGPTVNHRRTLNRMLQEELDCQ